MTAVDEILNKLSELIESTPSEREYCGLLFRQLIQWLPGCSAYRIQPLPNSTWLVLQAIKSPADHASETEQVSDDLLATLLAKRLDAGAPQPQSWMQENRGWLAVPSSEETWQWGGVAIEFSSPTEESMASAVALAQSICHLLYSHAIRWQSQRWLDNTQELGVVLRNLQHSQDKRDWSFSLANDLRVYLLADRVTICQANQAPEFSVLAISDLASVPATNQLSDTGRLVLEKVRSTGRLALENLTSISETDKPITLGLPLAKSGDKDTALYVVLGEWSSQERFNDGIQRLRTAWAIIESALIPTQRWLDLPKSVRSFYSWYSAKPNILNRFKWQFAFGVSACLIAMWPATLHIDGNGKLEPVNQAYIFAAHDGFVDDLPIREGNEVKKGDKLLALRSPELALEIEKTLGELNGLQEKRNGFQISLNQLSGQDTETQLARSQLSAEMVELNLYEQQLRDILKLQEENRSDLVHQSPIDGMIVTENIRSLLEHRPVKRGEALLQVADVKGPWHIRCEIADNDAGYLSRRLAEDTSLTCTVRLASLPSKTFEGRIDRISQMVRKNDDQQAVWIAYVQIAAGDPSVYRYGANARLQFNCGRKPLVFVWLRPLLENLRRRFWL